jgi:hypothetical protein
MVDIAFSCSAASLAASSSLQNLCDLLIIRGALMTSIERNDLMPTQKLEWVTPKISLMATTETDGAKPASSSEQISNLNGPS